MTARAGERRVIDGPAGALEIHVNAPAAPRGIALVAHPHPQQGGTLDNKVVQTLARTFASLGYAAVRFNFRGVGASAGIYDEGRGETDDALAALRYAQETYALHAPPVLAGFSFGSFVVTRVAATEPCERMVLVGPAVGRFAVAPVRADTLVIHGEEDDVVPLAKVLEWARPQQLPVVVFPGTGHFFHGRLVVLANAVSSFFGQGGAGGNENSSQHENSDAGAG